MAGGRARFGRRDGTARVPTGGCTYEQDGRRVTATVGDRVVGYATRVRRPSRRHVSASPFACKLATARTLEHERAATTDYRHTHPRAVATFSVTPDYRIHD